MSYDPRASPDRTSSTSASSDTTRLTRYDNEGVQVAGVPEDQKPRGNPTDEAKKTVDHRTGAEALAASGAGAGDVGEGAARAQDGGKGGAPGGKPQLDKYAYGCE